MPGRTRFALIRLLIGCVLSLCACSRKGAPKGTATTSPAARITHVTLALNWVPEPEFGGFYAAREDGAFRQNDLDVEIRGGGADVPVIQLVATGRVEFATAGAHELVTAKARGADVVAVFATFQTSPQCIMAHRERHYTKLDDVFQSGTVALESGAAFTEFLKAKYKWGKAAIVPFDGGIAHFLVDPNFSQQGYATSEPIAARRAGANPQVFLIADAGFNPYDTVVVTSRSLVEKQPGLVKKFVASVRAGWQDYLRDPAPTNAVLHGLNRSLDATTLAAVADAQRPFIETASTRALGLGTMTAERFSALAKTLVDLGFIPKAPDPATLFISPPIARARRAARTRSPRRAPRRDR